MLRSIMRLCKTNIVVDLQLNISCIKINIFLSSSKIFISYYVLADSAIRKDGLISRFIDFVSR